MVTYKKHLSEPYFSLVRKGIKTVEGRLNTGDWTKMNPGDRIIFWNNQNNPDLRNYETSYNDEGHQEISTRIVDVRWEPTFLDLFAVYGESLLPNVQSEDTVNRIYLRKFGGIYAQEDQDKYGVLGIDLELDI